MEAAELRLGNYLKVDGEVFVLVEISDSSLQGYMQKDVGNHVMQLFRYRVSQTDPIPITAGWLKSLGWKKINELDDGTVVYQGTPYLYFADGEGQCMVKTPPIKYVHQLQNLYFVLTGQELGKKKQKKK